MAVYPSQLTKDLDNVISVANTTSSDELSSTSHYGAKSVDIAAPGTDIYSTIPTSSYGTMSGTSMATPMVASAVAVMRAVNPNISAKEIKETFGLDDTALVEQNQIGGAVGKELTRKSLIAVGISCIAMLIYIAIRFQLAFGVAAIIALLHDVLVTLTVYLVFDINVNTPFIAAMLTIVGYSINDTIVVFDRVLENLKN